ncbi:DegT/DnrJ/EryC1/StrS family aminotransferase [Candidatus Halobonum tyrrellensis]|uniref:DegT/DnrJ/EryC1/StrS aminotransferase n=1 Tax=Candidatus Halobonum tyrrellensis G22 TaxID=1324957 RepID=V4GNE2_9EURY|nr:DegT/DnrJ/EryC1/StrS family aminotransferase [Candidatus Halobonum tyrrellensis]ESP86911.1 DegT/DnrJ/EryC1/StrS aminotransferase [Candidatus Halobonum tyrrellensis G22]
MTGEIPIADPQLGDAEAAKLTEVLDSGWLAGGPEVEAFEREFAAAHGADHAVATANGTAALHAAFEGLEIGPGDRVVTSPFSFVASANAVRLAGAEPVFADIDPETYALDPAAVDDALSAHDADAVLAVHLFGLPADVHALRDVADDHGVPLVEDAAQAHGATVDGRPVGSLGDVACFSFYPTKNMTTGEGGAVLTDDPDVAERVRRYANHGRATDGGTYEHVSVGHNYRMPALAAGLGRVQLDRLPEFTDARREHAAALTERLSAAETPVTPPVEPDGRTHVYHQYTVRCDDRDALASHLDDRGVGSAVYYPHVIPDQPAYDGVDADVPAAREAARTVLSLPVHPGLSDEDVRRIGDAVVDFGTVTADE